MPPPSPSTRVEMRRRMTLIGAMMVHLGDADGMVCGSVGAYHDHLRFVDEVIGRRPGHNVYAAMNILLLNERTVVLVDTHVNDEPGREQIAEFTVAAARQMRRMNLAQGGAAVAFELRLGQLGLGREDAPCAGAGAPGGSGAGDRRRDARRLRAGRGAADAHPAFVRSGAMPTCWCARTWTRATSPTTCSRRRLAATWWRWVRSGRERAGAHLTSSSTVRRIVNMTAMTVVDVNTPR